MIMFLHFRNSINPLQLVQFDIDDLAVFYQVDQKKHHAKYQGSAVADFPVITVFILQSSPIILLVFTTELF